MFLNDFASNCNWPNLNHIHVVKFNQDNIDYLDAAHCILNPTLTNQHLGSVL